MPTRLTLDTNLLQAYWLDQAKRDLVEQLLQLAAAGEVDLVVTNRITADIPGEPLAQRLRELPEMGIGKIGGAFRLDVSELDGGDMLGSDLFVSLTEQANIELLRRGRRTDKIPDWRDWDHLHGHFLKRRDVFLTWDKRLLEGAAIVAERLPVKAMTPETFLTARTIANEVVKNLESDEDSTRQETSGENEQYT